MKIITISREFGSGGRELGKRLAEYLGFDYYDSEIIYSVANNIGLDTNYTENVLEDHGWKNIPITFRGTIGSSSYMQAGKIRLLLEQKKVIEQIAEWGQNFVIVGRNADVLLREYEPFNIFVCADQESKLCRCKERADDKDNLTDKELLRKMKEIDHARAQTRELLTGSDWGARENYHLTLNTSGWEIKKMVSAVAYFASVWFER